MISSLVTSLSSDLKETLHKDLEVAREQLEKMNPIIEKIIEVAHHLFNHKDRLAIYIIQGSIILLNKIQLFCQAFYHEHIDIRYLSSSRLFRYLWLMPGDRWADES